MSVEISYCSKSNGLAHVFLHVLLSAMWSLLFFAFMSLNTLRNYRETSGTEKVLKFCNFQSDVKLFATFLLLQNGKCQRLVYIPAIED